MSSQTQQFYENHSHEETMGDERYDEVLCKVSMQK